MQSVKRTIWQRLRLGVTRFVRHTVCMPFYLLLALYLGAMSGFTLGTYGFVVGNLYEKLFVVSFVLFAIVYYVVAATATVFYLPFRSFILTMRNKGDENEEIIQEYIEEFKIEIGFGDKKKKTESEPCRVI